MKLCVKDIFYSKKFIDYYFDNGGTLLKFCDDLLKVDSTLKILHPIDVVYQDGHYVVKDGNRRLFVLKILYKKGMFGDGKFPVRLVSTNRKLDLVTDAILRYNTETKKDIEKCIDDYQNTSDDDDD